MQSRKFATITNNREVDYFSRKTEAFKWARYCREAGQKCVVYRTGSPRSNFKKDLSKVKKKKNFFQKLFGL